MVTVLGNSFFEFLLEKVFFWWRLLRWDAEGWGCRGKNFVWVIYSACIAFLSDPISTMPHGPCVPYGQQPPKLTSQWSTRHTISDCACAIHGLRKRPSAHVEMSGRVRSMGRTAHKGQAKNKRLQSTLAQFAWGKRAWPPHSAHGAAGDKAACWEDASPATVMHRYHVVHCHFIMDSNTFAHAHQQRGCLPPTTPLH